MKKLVLVTTILTSLVASSIFASNLGGSAPTAPAKTTALKKAQSNQKDACGLDMIGNTLTMMVQQGLKEGIVTFASGSNVEKTLENLQSATCSNTKGINITSKEGIVMVSRSSSSDHYMFSAWYKGGQAVCAVLNSDYQIE